MRPGPRHYVALEAAAIAAQSRTDLDPTHDPFAFEDDPGPHSRLVSAFAWHPLFRRTMGLPPLGLFLIGWLSAAIFHLHSRIPQLWADEAFTWELATGTVPALMSRLANDLHPPLYFVLANLLAHLGISDPIQLRVALYVPVALGLGLLPLMIQAWPPIWRRFAAMGALVLVLFPFDLYLLQLRYYGLLTLLLVTAIVALGNSLETGDRRGRWRLVAQVCFVLACLTNYQSWLVWIVAESFAMRLRESRSQSERLGETRSQEDVPRDRDSLSRNLIWMLGTALLTWGWFAAFGLSPLNAFRDATDSPFTTGFASTLLEAIARLGVMGLVTLASEMVPLWWLPLIAIGVAVWWTRSPHPTQSPLSTTATLCLRVAAIVTLTMCALTVSALPVGVEFLPARLAYVTPLWWIGLTEWTLRRSYAVRWPLLLLVVHWIALGLTYLQVAEAMSKPAPAPGAPFLHATYLAPVIAVRNQVRADLKPKQFPHVYADSPGTALALGRTLGMYRSAAFVSESTLGPYVYVLKSTRQDLQASGDAPPQEAFQAGNISRTFPVPEGMVIDESWLLVHEDPLWFALKKAFLQRDVQPYKYRLTRYRRHDATASD